MEIEGVVNRAHLLRHLADLIAAVDQPCPVRVAIDGVDAAGKTRLADELVMPLEDRSRVVIRASIDSFYRPRAERYRRGPDSPEGYFYDSFDYVALRELLLDPLGPGGDRQFRVASFDTELDEAIDDRLRHAPVDSVLLFDGVFLMRPELEDCWDFRVFVDVDFEEAIRRAVQRDQPLFDTEDSTLERYWTRYVAAQRLYIETARPLDQADAIVVNQDPAHPRLIVPYPPQAESLTSGEE
ncbi:MAG TPA: uridine kinase [Chloroflexota bacterium]|nr:uridine kinase [Chloroflexota bacterium]